VNVSSSAGAIRPATVSAASATATHAWNTCTPTNIRRRSRMSANAPDGSASTSAGSMAATWTIATSASAPGSSTSSHWAPTVCIQVPIRLPTCASHSDRNAAIRKGAHVDSAACLRPCAGSDIHPSRCRPPSSGDGIDDAGRAARGWCEVGSPRLTSLLQIVRCVARPVPRTRNGQVGGGAAPD
jgi:hypothetical protein